MIALFKKIKNILFKKNKTNNSQSIKEAFEKIKFENTNRDSRINKIFSRLNSHFLTLQSHTKEIRLLKNEIAGYKKLAEEISKIRTYYNQNQPIKRLNEPTNRLNATNQITEQPLSMTSLSTQEKRILMVLFDNTGTALSYEDIAKLLHKAPNTVKTQINQLKNKTNLLKETIDSEGKKRYCLKEKVKLEKFVS